METIKNIDNKLFGRKEVQVKIELAKTPSFVEASKLLADEFKANEENIMVENVKGNFGSNTFSIKASIYDTKELKDGAVQRLTKKKKEAAAPAA